MTDVDDFLGGSRAPGFSWKNATVGTGYKDAKVISSRVVQVREYPSGEPLFYKVSGRGTTTENTGQPVMQLEVTLQHPDWVGEVDDKGNVNKEGIKRDYFAGAKSSDTSGIGSLIAALKKAESKLLDGGQLSRQMIGGEATIESPRQYRTKYVKPVFGPDDSWDEEPF